MPNRSHHAARTLLALVATGCLAAPSDALAFDPWLRPQDTFELELDSRWGTASEQFDENGTSIPLVEEGVDASVGWFDLTLAAEYGLFETLAVALSLDLARHSVDGPSSSASVIGLGDVGIAVGWSAWRDVVDLSVVLDTRWPTGYSASPGGFVPSLGDGAPAITLLAVVGRQYYEPFQFSVATGYRYRGERVDTATGSTNLRDQIPFILSASLDVRENVRVELDFDGALGFGRPVPFDTLELRPDTEDYLTGSLMVSTPLLDRYRAGVGYQRTLVGIGALAGQSLLLSFSLEETL